MRLKRCGIAGMLLGRCGELVSLCYVSREGAILRLSKDEDMKCAIVTGANGFIGGWLIGELLETGYTVVAIVRNRNKYIAELQQLNEKLIIVEKDLWDLQACDVPKRKYDVFFNLAWAGVSPEVKNNFRLQYSNIELAMRALKLCHDVCCDLFIGIGTVAEYALTPEVMDLKSRQTPNDMYGASKVAAHYYIDVGARQLHQKYIWVVLPSTFGERRLDNNIITYTIKSLLKKERPVYGDLSQMWDFLYVSEVVYALRLVAEKGKNGIVYGIGSGQYKTLKEYICQIKEIMNSDIELGIGEIKAQNERTLSSCVNIYDLIRDTGFSPRVSFEIGIERTVNYWKERM